MRVMIVGSGHIGGELAHWLHSSGATPMLCSRRPPTRPSSPGSHHRVLWHQLDATNRIDCARAVDTLRPDAIVLVHGPSDVTWCEAHPAEAIAAHAAATTNLAVESATLRTILISTDNVFAGDTPSNDETSPIRPANAYGRAKHQAERILLDRNPNATVLRVSLVYGWRRNDNTTWLNHFARCADLLRRGETIPVPDDHWNTPVLVEDAVRVIAALLPAQTAPLLHLGGPDRISRFHWALRIADTLGFARDAVIAVPREDSHYACRPVNACLTSVRLGREPATRAIPIRGVDAGLRALAQQPPQWWTSDRTA